MDLTTAELVTILLALRQRVKRMRENGEKYLDSYFDREADESEQLYRKLIDSTRN